MTLCAALPPRPGAGHIPEALWSQRVLPRATLGTCGQLWPSPLLAHSWKKEFLRVKAQTSTSMQRSTSPGNHAAPQSCIHFALWRYVKRGKLLLQVRGGALELPLPTR
jgi:hypothetical protein